jgi:hypothetical protein
MSVFIIIKKTENKVKLEILAISKSKGTYLAFFDADDFWTSKIRNAN